MSRNSRPILMVLPGDGIGQEVIKQAVRVLEWFAAHRGFDCTLQHGDFGVGAYYRSGRIMKDELLADILAADAVLFGAMGGDADHRAIPQEIRRREGLPGVRKATHQAIDGGSVLELVVEEERVLAAVIGLLDGRGRHLQRLSKREPTLEDVFVDLVGRSMAEVEHAPA